MVYVVQAETQQSKDYDAVLPLRRGGPGVFVAVAAGDDGRLLAGLVSPLMIS